MKHVTVISNRRARICSSRDLSQPYIAKTKTFSYKEKENVLPIQTTISFKKHKKLHGTNSSVIGPYLMFSDQHREQRRETVAYQQLC